MAFMACLGPWTASSRIGGLEIKAAAFGGLCARFTGSYSPVHIYKT